MILPAISIKEPWASMIAQGEKTIEIRSWRTSLRGRIILCASKNPSGIFAGHAFALVEIADIRPMCKNDTQYSCSNFFPDHYSWILQNIQTFRPFPISGRPGIFKIDVKQRQAI